SGFDWSSIDTSQLPSSYKMNSLKEEKLLNIADCFLQQYTHLCPDRKPLFLHPVNECGAEKFVSTTVRPTLLPYAELYHWDGCASFVSDYLTMEPLKSPLTPVRKGLLSHQKSPIMEEAKKKAETEAAQNKEGEEEKVTGVEKHKRDPLHGLWVHAWVLVLSGKREVPETFFINPFTGNSHSTMDEQFLGIESVWNHKNYWINMQDCRNGCKDLIFDLSDTIRWEMMLLGSSKPLQLPEAEKEKELPEAMDDMHKEDVSFDMPPSWVAPIQISPREFETHCSQGSKVILYKQAKLEKWAPYLNENGLVKRLTIYEDFNYTEAVEIREWFKNREDLLDMRQVNIQTQVTTDFFSPGRLLNLKAHTYKSLEPRTERTMEFYHVARVDGLQKRVENATEMIEYFVGREDFLHVRHTEFGKKQKKIQLAGTTTDNFRPIVQIKEYFHRNLEKPADEDVAERTFLITEDVISLTYHLKDKYITASKKDFFKVAEDDRRGDEAIMTPEMCITYQAGSSEKDKKLIPLYKLLQELTIEEKRLKQQVQQSEAEVLNILEIRENEESNIKLSVSIFNTERNEMRRQQYGATEKGTEDELPGQKEQDVDYLAPFLIRLGNREQLTKGQALHVRDDCLMDFKHRLVKRVTTIQARFEKAVEELQKRKQWFQDNRNQLSTKEEDDFLACYSEAMFHIHILKLRLSREKQTAPQKYLALEEKLRKDPRLTEHLSHA
ncbi:Coiled-coil domain-containing protein lobo, partial [Calypte anna]